VLRQGLTAAGSGPPPGMLEKPAAETAGSAADRTPAAPVRP